MPKVAMSITLDVNVASFIADKYASAREQSAFINAVLSDYIKSQSVLTPEMIDKKIQEIESNAKKEIMELLEKKKRMIE